MRKIFPIIASVAVICGAIATIFLISNSHQEDLSLEAANDGEQTTTNSPSTSGGSMSQDASSNNDSEGSFANMLRDKRDEQRIRDMAFLQAAVTQFQTNNNGKLPGQAYQYDDNGAIISNSIDGQGELLYQPSQDYTLPPASDGVAAKLITYYLNNGLFDTENHFIDPDGWTYGLTIIHHDYYETLPSKAADHMIYLVHQSTCGVATDVMHSDKPRDFAILYQLENGNLYCLDNQ